MFFDSFPNFYFNNLDPIKYIFEFYQLFFLFICHIGAFLIPFFVMLILEGIPLFLIELGIGQRMRLGSLGVWNTIHPWLGGIGISSCMVTLFVALYYNVVITWCFFYLFNSFRVRFVSYSFSLYRLLLINHFFFVLLV